MSAKRPGVTAIGVGAAACVACCAGPIFGFFAAIGIGAVAGVALFGAVGLVVGIAGVIVMMTRQRHHSAASQACTTARSGPVTVAAPTIRSR